MGPGTPFALAVCQFDEVGAVVVLVHNDAGRPSTFVGPLEEDVLSDAEGV